MAKFFDIARRKKEEKDEIMPLGNNRGKFTAIIFYSLISILLITGIIYVGSKFSLKPPSDKGSKKEAQGVIPAPTPTQTTSVSETPESATVTSTPAPTETSAPAATTTETPTPSPTPTSTISNKNQYKIRIINSYATAATINDVKKKLTDAGYAVSDIVPVTKRYTSYIVFYKKGQKDLATDLSSILSKYSPTIDQSTTANYDASIVVIK